MASISVKAEAAAHCAVPCPCPCPQKRSVPVSAIVRNCKSGAPKTGALCRLWLASSRLAENRGGTQRRTARGRNSEKKQRVVCANEMKGGKRTRRRRVAVSNKGKNTYVGVCVTAYRCHFDKKVPHSSFVTCLTMLSRSILLSSTSLVAATPLIPAMQANAHPLPMKRPIASDPSALAAVYVLRAHWPAPARRRAGLGRQACRRSQPAPPLPLTSFRDSRVGTFRQCRP